MIKTEKEKNINDTRIEVSFQSKQVLLKQFNILVHHISMKNILMVHQQ